MLKIIKEILRVILISAAYVWCAFIIAYAIVGECEAGTTIASDNTENNYSVPVQTPSAHLSLAKNVYSVPVSLKKGDIVMVTGQVQVTTELPFKIMYGSFISLSVTPYDFKYMFTRPHGTNITKSIHHHSEQISAARLMPNDFNGYLVFVVYSSSALGKGTIQVEKGYGNMSVVIIRQ